MSGLTISGASAPDSLVKYAIMASLPSPRMDMCHLSEDVKSFASNFRTSGDTVDFKSLMSLERSASLVDPQRCRVQAFQSASCSSSSSCQRVRGSLASIGRFINHVSTSIYHMIYLVVNRCSSHGSPPSSS